MIEENDFSIFFLISKKLSSSFDIEVSWHQKPFQ